MKKMALLLVLSLSLQLITPNTIYATEQTGFGSKESLTEVFESEDYLTEVNAEEDGWSKENGSVKESEAPKEGESAEQTEMPKEGESAEQTEMPKEDESENESSQEADQSEESLTDDQVSGTQSEESETQTDVEDEEQLEYVTDENAQIEAEGFIQEKYYRRQNGYCLFVGVAMPSWNEDIIELTDVSYSIDGETPIDLGTLSSEKFAYNKPTWSDSYGGCLTILLDDVPAEADEGEHELSVYFTADDTNYALNGTTAFVDEISKAEIVSSSEDSEKNYISSKLGSGIYLIDANGYTDDEGETVTELQLVKNGTHDIAANVECKSSTRESRRYLRYYQGSNGLSYQIADELVPKEYNMHCRIDSIVLENNIDNGYYDILLQTSNGRKLRTEKAYYASDEAIIFHVGVANEAIRVYYPDNSDKAAFFSDNTGDYVSVYVYGLNLEKENIPIFYDTSGNEVLACYINGDTKCGYERGGRFGNYYRLKKTDVNLGVGAFVDSHATVEGDVIYVGEDNYCETYIDSDGIFFTEYFEVGKLYENSPGRLRLYIGENIDCEAGDAVTYRIYRTGYEETKTVQKNKNGKYIEFDDKSDIYRNISSNWEFRLLKDGKFLTASRAYSGQEKEIAIQLDWNMEIPSGGTWKIHPIGDIAETIYEGKNTAGSKEQLILTAAQISMLSEYGTVRVCIYRADGEVFDRRLVYFQGRTSESEEKFCTVTYDMQGHGIKIDPVTVKSGEKLATPSNPTAEGYSFKGWHREPECKTAWDFTKDTVTADVTLYAKWTKNQSDGYDLSSFHFQMTDIRNPEKKVDFNGADGKQAVIVFGGVGTCSRTESALESLSTLTSMADMTRLNIYVFEINKASDDTIRARTANISSQIVINSIENDTAYNIFYLKCFQETVGGGSLSMPLIIYKGTDGRIYKYTTNATDLPSVVRNVEEGGLKVHYNSSCQTLNITGESGYELAWEVLELLNAEREKEGLDKLKMDSGLLEAAMLRAAECSLYYSHTRPDGTECFTASDKMSGENIAVGHKTAKEVMNSWMNSEGHRKNILNSRYRSVGIGCFYINGTYRWVQCFGISNASETAKKTNLQKTYAVKTVPEHVSPYLVEKSGVLKTGESRQLKVESSHEVYRTSINTDSYRWESGNTEVADVSSMGLVMAKKDGSIVITGYNISDETLTLTYSLTIGEGVEVEFIVTFDSQGGTQVPAVRAVKDSVIAEPVAPTRQDYIFGGWYKEAACVTSWDFANDKVTENVTLYAKWINNQSGELEDKDDSPYQPNERIDLNTVASGVVANIKAKTFDGSPYEPTVKVTVREGSKRKTLTEGIDYRVLYRNNINAGTGTVIVKGNGIYKGEITKDFEMKPKPIKKLKVVTGSMTVGDKSKPPVCVYDGTRLLDAAEYRLDYDSGLTAKKTNAAKVTIIAADGSNYTGSVTAKLAVYEASNIINPVNVALKYTETTYTGKAIKDNEPTVKIGDYVLVKNKDYKVQFQNNTNAGTGFVIVTGKGAYKGKVVKPFGIKPVVGVQLSGKRIPDKIYNGKLQKPAVTGVRVGNKKLVKNKDYTVSYSNNLHAGTGRVKITGKGNYAGQTAYLTFTIKPQKISKVVVSILNIFVSTEKNDCYSLQINLKSLTYLVTTLGYSSDKSYHFKVL